MTESVNELNGRLSEAESTLKAKTEESEMMLKTVET